MTKTLSFEPLAGIDLADPGFGPILVATTTCVGSLSVAVIIDRRQTGWGWAVAGDVHEVWPDRFTTPTACMMSACIWVSEHLVECQAAWPDELDPPGYASCPQCDQVGYDPDHFMVGESHDFWPGEHLQPRTRDRYGL